MKKLLGLSVVLMIAPLAHAADIEAGKAKVATVCAACHGAGGVSDLRLARFDVRGVRKQIGRAHV